MNIDHPALKQIPQLRQLWKEAFGDSDTFLDVYFESVFSPQRCLCVFQEDEIAAAAYWFSCGEYAYIYAVATAKQHRSKGICHRLMDKIHTLLAQQGYDGCIVVPGEESLRRFYGGMGYENFGGMREFSCCAGTPLPIRTIDAAEFSAMRREYLPNGGVIQEKENVKLLSHIAQFYAGEDFLLAATLEDGTLRVMELLGNSDAAPGILAALGAASGSFRVPGDPPFAMYLSFGSKKRPTYFGFAFD